MYFPLKPKKKNRLSRRRCFCFPVAFLFAVTLSSRASTTFSVINTNNSGNGSLAQAITNANNTPGDDTITFDIALKGAHLISLTDQLPAITSNIVFLNDRPGDDPVTVTYAGVVFRVNAGTTVTFAGLTIDPAGAAGSQGINSANADVTVRNCTLTNNSLGAIIFGAGGGGNATLTLLNSTISHNNGPQGGGISLYASDDGGAAHLIASNCTFDDNSSVDHSGSAIDVEDAASSLSTVKLINCTFSNNPTAQHAATVLTRNASVQALNTIFLHEGDGQNIVVINSTFTSLGHNLSDLAEGGDLGGAPGGFFNGPGDKRNTNPQLGPRQNNGGRTETESLPANSAAVNAGDDAVLSPPYSLTTDQRGVARKNGAHVDIGAFEREVPQPGPTFTVTTLGDHDDGSCGPVDCTLLEAINAANANADANTIRFAAGLTGVVTRTGPPLDITHPVTIAGPGTFVISIDATSARVFTIESGAGKVSISDLDIVGGMANGSSYPDNCGGLILNSASLDLARCSLCCAHAALVGGAIYNNGTDGNASLTMRDCDIYSNQTDGSGGAIFNAGYNGHAMVDLTNCTFGTNSAVQYGGAIYNDGTLNGNASLTVTNCTFWFNSAGSHIGGGINNDGVNADSSGTAILTLRNNIFDTGDPAVDGGNLVNDGGTLISQGHNLSSDAANGDSSTGPGGYLNAAGDQRNTDPKLDNSLSSNNSLTGVPVVALLAGSPAINAGDDSFAPAHDARGYLRNGVSDIGACEANGINPSTIAGITNIARSGNNIVITFAGVSGKTFRLERNSNPHGGGWQSISGVADKTPASNGPSQFTDPNAISLGKAFYRVRSLP